MKLSKFKTTEIVAGLLYIFCLISSYAGFSQYFISTGETVGFWNKLYFTLQLFVFNFSITTEKLPVLLNIARFMSPLLLAGTILNLLFSTLMNRSNLLIIKYSFRDHLIFCGLGYKSFLLIEDYLKNDSFIKIVVIEKDISNPNLVKLKNNRVRFITGNSEDPEVLKNANVTKASVVFALTENDKTNISITQKIIEVFNTGGIEKPVKIILHISDHFNMNIFKEFQERNVLNIDFQAFNIYQKIASVAVSKFSPDLYRKFNSIEDPQCHILVHGLNNLGEQIIKESIQLYHFADLRKPKITIIDEKISEKTNDFRQKYPLINQVAEIEFYSTMEIFNDIPAGKLQEVTLCFICCETESQSYEIAKKYRQLFCSLYIKGMPLVNGEKKSDYTCLANPHIVVFLPKDPDILNLFNNVNSVSEFLHIDRFAFYDSVCKKEMIADNEDMIDNIAMRIHNIYQGLEDAELMKNWERLTDREKDFNRYPARHLAVKLRYLNTALVQKDQQGGDFDIKRITVSERLIIAKMEHNRWVAEKILGGYMSVEELSDKEFQSMLKSALNLHKDIREWNELSETDRNKDAIITDNIHAIITALGKKLIKN